MENNTGPARRFGGGGPTLAEVGESTLLERLVEIAVIAGGRAPGVADDAHVWTPPAGRDLATSIDALVEGIDFRRDWIEPEQLGRRAFAIAASDLAGSGAEPVNCVATVCARPDEQLEDVLAVQRGLCAAAADAGCAVVGGDVSATTGPLVIDVCVTGSIPAGRALRRDGGVAGDLLLVTGSLGRAAAGLRLLLDGHTPGTALERAWVAAQVEPRARLRQGQGLLAAGVACGGDISDGLLVDVTRTARASGCGADIWVDSLPVDAHLRERFGGDWPALAIGGGEDFELLVAASPELAGRLLRDGAADGVSLSLVGALRAGSAVRLLESRDGPEVPLPAAVSRHFS